MRVFLDSSALAKRYVSEPGTDAVLARCAGATEVVLSVACVPEMISAFTRLRREHALTARRYASLKRDLATDVAQASIVPLTDAVVERTIEILERTALRTLDAMHVASAIEASCELFVTADLRQARAGRSMGLTVEVVHAG
jgi:predicted nucleic acid-binding protein